MLSNISEWKNTNSKTFWEPAVNKRLLNSSFENQLVLIKKMTKVFQNTCEGVPFYKSFESSDTASKKTMMHQVWKRRVFYCDKATTIPEKLSTE